MSEAFGIAPTDPDQTSKLQSARVAQGGFKIAARTRLSALLSRHLLNPSCDRPPGPRYFLTLVLSQSQMTSCLPTASNNAITFETSRASTGERSRQKIFFRHPVCPLVHRRGAVSGLLQAGSRHLR